MDVGLQITISIIITFFLILLNGYFSMSEMALVSAKKNRLEAMRDTGDKAAEKALMLQEDTDRFLSTIQVAITLVGFGASAAAATTLSNPLTHLLDSAGLPWLSTVAPVLSVVVVTVLVSYVTLVLGELVPKRIALSNPEKTARRVAGPVMTFQKVTQPLVNLLSVSTAAVARVFGIKGAEEAQSISEEDIKHMVAEQDDLLDEEKRMIHEVIAAGDTIAREIMVPRVDAVMVRDELTVREVLDVMRKTGFSRIPVYRGRMDHVLGMAHIKDIIVPVVEGQGEMPITECMRETMFVPDTKDILPLLSEMQMSHHQIVVLVDEHGGMAGLLTIEDIVEEIVGEIEDEFDPDNKYFTVISDHEFLVGGRYPISDAIEQGFPIEDTDEYETIAGWVIDINECLPQIGDVIECEGWKFTIQSMSRRRIELVRVEKPYEPENSADEHTLLLAQGTQRQHALSREEQGQEIGR